MVELYLKNEKTGKRFKIVKLDKQTNKVTLRGQYADFVEVFDTERFKKLGYTLEKVGAPDGNQEQRLQT
jgi:hypothetical protein